MEARSDREPATPVSSARASARDVDSLAELVDAPALQSMMDDFYALTSIPMSLIDLEGNIIVGAGWQDVCIKFHRANPESCAHCIESDTVLTSDIPEGQAKLYRCKNGMWDAAMPVVVDGERVANVFTGQFFMEDEEVDLEFFRAQAKRYGFAEPEYIAAVLAVPRLGQRQVEAGLRFLTKLADMLSRLTFANSGLTRLASERQDLLDRERRQSSRLRTLSSIESALTSSLDLREVIGDALRAAEDHLRVSASTVWAVDAQGDHLRLIGARGFPDAFFAEFAAGIPITEPYPAADAARTGERVVFGNVRDSELHEPVRAAYARHGIDVRSLVALPLFARGSVIGSMTMAWEERPRLDEDEMALIVTLASRFAVAMENARLFESEHMVAETLQETLVVLPAHVPGVTFSRAYESATYESGRVGGDFVDIFPVDDNVIGITLGDVSGKGLGAAVATSLIRTTLRVLALDGLSPDAIANRANRIIRRFGEVESFVTLWFGLLHTDTGLLRYVCAGHPPGLVLNAEGKVQALECHDPILGAFDAATYFESQTVLADGERLVLYSDGATEARSSEGVFLGEERFASIVGGHRATPTANLSYAVMNDIVGYSDGVLRDDIAILAVERTSADTADAEPPGTYRAP